MVKDIGALQEKKPWITDQEIKDLDEKVEEFNKWLKK